MKRARGIRPDSVVSLKDVDSAPGAEKRLSLVRTTQPAPLPSITMARIARLENERVVVILGGAEVSAKLDPGVHPAVIAGAQARGERVLLELGEGDAPVVVGALRTQPTPGIDVVDAYTIEAKRVSIKATEEVSLSTQAAGLAIRALGEVETYAERILSRAEGVHKIVGRMLRLN